MTAPVAVPPQARHIRDEWLRLATPAVSPAALDPAMLDPLPEPARRWLRQAIAPGTPLWQTAQLSHARADPHRRLDDLCEGQ
jgi:hypothetical protein